MAHVYASQADEPYGHQGSFGIFKRVSWGALFAGIVVTLIIQLWLTLLGLGIGLGSINPATEQSPFSGMGIGSAIWFGLSTLIALFIGGWVTARLAGSPRGMNGVLHSIVMWGSVTLASFFLMTTAIGSLVSGVAGVVGKGVSAATKAASAAAPDIQQELQQRGISVDSIMKEAQKMLGQNGQQQKGAAAGGAGSESGDQDLRRAIQNIFSSGQKTVSAADRDSIVNTLVSRSNMDRAEAEKRVDGWIQQYQQAAEGAEQAKQQALQTAQQATDALSRAAIWISVLMLLSALAAAVGGWLGSSPEFAPPGHS